MTERNVRIAGDLLGCASIEIANLYARPTRDLPSMAREAHDEAGWLEARPLLEAALARADVVVLGWGVSSFSKQARGQLTGQIAWLRQTAASLGKREAYQVGALPRHPSRWRQYTSPVHGRFSGGTFESRLAESLQRQLLSELPATR